MGKVKEKTKCSSFSEVKVNQFFKYENRVWKKISKFEAETDEVGAFGVFNPGCQVQILLNRK